MAQSPPYHPTVSVAGPADLGEVLRLHELARGHVGSARGGEVLLGREVRAMPAEASLREELASPRHLVLLGRLGSTPVGLAVAALEELHDGSLLAQIEELFVEQDARDVGVGAVMMEALLEWAGEHGCAGIGSVVLPGDRDSKNFFESHGLVARAIAVHRDLGKR